MKKVLALFLVISWLLAGCSLPARVQNSGSIHNLVLSVSVEDSSGHGGFYFEPEKVEAILHYFRDLKLNKSALSMHDAKHKITLHYSDGHRKTYYLVDECYLRAGDGAWMSIGELPEVCFQQLLDEYPPDEKDTPYG